MRYALVNKDTGIVEGVAIWDGMTTYNPQGCVLVKLDDDSLVSDGWTYADGTFTAPTE